jgi:16S rRNA (guanine527-N7)-methyltransferase
MQPARIAELLQPFLAPISNPCHSESGRTPDEEPAVLSSAQLKHISTYIDILLHWNARINLTAIRDPEEIVTRHFGESLFAAKHLFPTDLRVDAGPGASEGQVDRADREVHLANGVPDAARSGLKVADLGSGAGFPGIPIKLWSPGVSLTLIESNQKKATFLREVVRTLALTDVNILNERAESITQRFEVVTVRAVERFADILPIAARLVGNKARLALLIAASQIETAHATLPTLTWQTPFPVPGSKARILVIGKQVSEVKQWEDTAV